MLTESMVNTRCRQFSTKSTLRERASDEHSGVSDMRRRDFTHTK